MLDVMAVDELAASGTETGLKLVLVRCPLCGADEAEPVAVGSDFAHSSSRDSFLAVRCTECELTYLNPRPAPEERPRLYPPDYFSSVEPGGRRALGSSRAAALRTVRRCRSLAPNGRVLVAAYGAALNLETVRQAGQPGWAVEALTPHERLARGGRQQGVSVHQGRAPALRAREGAYDVVFFLDALEHCESPLEELRSLRRLLREGGRLVLFTQNADSAVGRTFRGRHWAGYDFPRHVCLFGPGALRRLAREADLVIERLGTVGSPEVWVRSAAQLLDDWRAPAWLRGSASRGSFVLRGMAALAESGARLRGQGAVIEAVLRHPGEADR
jgi:SAM-dependent methyltransferase